MPSPLQSCRQQQYYVARDDRIPLVAEKASIQTVANLPPINQLLQQSANGNYRLPPPLKRAVTFPRGSYPTTTNPCGLFTESELDRTNDPPAASHSGLYKKSHSLTSVDTLAVRQALLRFDASQKKRKFQIYPMHNSSDREDLGKLDMETFKHVRLEPLTCQKCLVSGAFEPMDASFEPNKRFAWHANVSSLRSEAPPSLNGKFQFHYTVPAGLEHSSKIRPRYTESIHQNLSLKDLPDDEIKQERADLLQSHSDKQTTSNTYYSHINHKPARNAYMGSLSNIKSPSTHSKQMSKPRKSRNRSKGMENNVCHACHTTSTPEWRKGPAGPRTLCNACGLLFAKSCRRRELQVSVRNQRLDLLETKDATSKILPGSDSVRKLLSGIPAAQNQPS